MTALAPSWGENMYYHPYSRPGASFCRAPSFAGSQPARSSGKCRKSDLYLCSSNRACLSGELLTCVSTLAPGPFRPLRTGRLSFALLDHPRTLGSSRRRKDWPSRGCILTGPSSEKCVGSASHSPSAEQFNTSATSPKLASAQKPHRPAEMTRQQRHSLFRFCVEQL
jgi:hypothetical protein